MRNTRQFISMYRFLLILGFSAFSVTLGNPLPAQRGGDEPASVVVKPAVLSKQADIQTFVGTLNPIRKSTVGSAVEGRLIAMMVEPGDLVGSDSESKPENFIGQPLANILTDELDIEIASATVEHKLRQQTLEELKLSLPEDIELAKAEVARTQAEFDFAEKNYLRIQRLAQNAGLSSREVAESESLYSARQQSLTAAKVNLRKLESTQQIKLNIAQSRVEAQKKVIEQLKIQLAKHTIRAPFIGAVTRKTADVGDWLTKGTPIVEIIQLDPIELIAQVPQNYLPRLQQAMNQQNEIECEITIDGFESTFSGTVHSIVPMADVRSRTFPVTIRMDNSLDDSDYQLKPGMLARAGLPVGLVREVVLVPKDALVLGNNQTTVWIASADEKGHTARPVVVEMGQSYSDSVEILKGISDGDLVIIEGNERVRPGQQLKILDQ